MEHKRKVTEDITLDKGGQVTLSKRGTVVIEVIDDGVGMTPEQVRTVFNDGTQFNANKFQAGGGSGLGLSIAKGIATQHGGRLTCSSEGMGKGSTFTLSLPLYDSNELQATARTAFTRFDSGLTEKSTVFDIPELNILVVDDSTTSRKLCVRLLEKHGHTCASACDGKEAIQSVKEALEKREPYDCILLDYEMPNMNGPETCENIRKMGCSAYIVGVTGNVMSEDVAHFRNCGANWVLPKPFRLDSLEQQWVEDGVTAHTKNEAMIRVESGNALNVLNVLGELVQFEG
jgi:CheY-like chemotaxis protein